MGLTTVQRYCAACDVVSISIADVLLNFAGYKIIGNVSETVQEATLLLQNTNRESRGSPAFAEPFVDWNNLLHIYSYLYFCLVRISKKLQLIFVTYLCYTNKYKYE